MQCVVLLSSFTEQFRVKPLYGPNSCLPLEQKTHLLPFSAKIEHKGEREICISIWKSHTISFSFQRFHEIFHTTKMFLNSQASKNVCFSSLQNFDSSFHITNRTLAGIIGFLCIPAYLMNFNLGFLSVSIKHRHCCSLDASCKN